MSLPAGTKLGPYEILSPLGAGGMGEVYRAKDTRLGRSVAVKVLPQHLSSSAEVRQRFEREAKAIAALSHPHICALYDVGREGETEYLVMELLEGQTLSERLARGPLPVGEALRFGVEIASALDAAHRKGIVHRDLKPGNIMLTPSGVKLLDFGLARALAPEGPLDNLTAAPTAAKNVTREGSILGTLAYMAPEQLEGKPADARTDVFALGTVLYEMATGRKAFSGSSQASLISAILTSEPMPLTAIQPLHPAPLDSLVRTCLAKDPARRWHSAHDVALQLEAVGESRSSSTGAAPVSGRRRFAVLPWAAAALCLAAAILAVARGRAPTNGVLPTLRFEVPPPSGKGFFPTVETTSLAVSPDGSRIAFVVTGEPQAGPSTTAAAEAEEGRGIWVRDLSDLAPRRIAGTEGAYSVFWSPDGRSLGFFTPKNLKRVEISGGAPVPVCDLPVGSGRSASWGLRGDILITNIQEAALARGPRGRWKARKAHRGRSLARRNAPELALVSAGRRAIPVLGPAPRWNRRGHVRGAGKASARAVPRGVDRPVLRAGILVFARDGALFAQRFDWRKGWAGEPFSIAERVEYFLTSGYATFNVSLSGALAYQSHFTVSRLAWLDRAGQERDRWPSRQLHEPLLHARRTTPLL